MSRAWDCVMDYVEDTWPCKDVYWPRSIKNIGAQPSSYAFAWDRGEIGMDDIAFWWDYAHFKGDFITIKFSNLSQNGVTPHRPRPFEFRYIKKPKDKQGIITLIDEVEFILHMMKVKPIPVGEYY